jgi:sphingomyelin phosphodiesterase 2
MPVGDTCLTIYPLSGALGAGLAFFSKYPLIGASVHPYSLNGSPIDVTGGDWFVGKAATSIIIEHPLLGEVEIFNTHVREMSRQYGETSLNAF